MQPNMRYHCAKLSELVHQKKNYHLHVSSVDKIMNKNNDEFIKRSMQLQEIKNRKMQSFNYMQHRRSQDIGHVNSLLYTKICFPSKSFTKKEAVNNIKQSFEHLEEQINQRNKEEAEEKKEARDYHFILRNHRQSPIHKSTLLERTRENIRLAKKIVNPVITYRTSQFQKLHKDASTLKSRIMKYNQELAKTKAQIYVQKRLSTYQRKGSIGSSRDRSDVLKNTFFETDNPESGSKIYMNRKIPNTASHSVVQKQ